MEGLLVYTGKEYSALSKDGAQEQRTAFSYREAGREGRQLHTLLFGFASVNALVVMGNILMHATCNFAHQEHNRTFLFLTKSLAQFVKNHCGTF